MPSSQAPIVSCSADPSGRLSAQVSGFVERAMYMRAEIHCYHCGHVSGTWVWSACSSPYYGRLHAAKVPPIAARGLTRLRCLRYGGPVFLDDVALVRISKPLAIERGRPGRPRKQPAPLAS